jgi:tetratricopeptide (TPR) repeat protein
MRSTRESLLASLALGLGLAVALPIAVPAFAQSGASSGGYPAACDPKSLSKADVDRAHTVFLSGKGFLDESNYDKAISYFKDAYSIDCSVHAILPIIATAYERKGDKASAITALQEYLKRVPNASDREVIERRIKNLQDQLSAAAVASAPTASASASATASAPPSATASAPVAPPTATAIPTSSATAAPPPEPGGHSVAPWIVVGIGGAAVVAGVVLYAVGNGDVNSAANACPSRVNCAQSVADQGNNGRTLDTVGVVVGAVGLAGVAGGLVWHFLEPTGSSGSTGASLTPAVAPGYAGLNLGGKF